MYVTVLTSVFSPRSGKSRPNGVWISELRLVNIRNRTKILMRTYLPLV